MKAQTQVLYEFSGFRLDPGQRILWRNGEPVTLTPKGFDTLLFLVQNSGRILEKGELMKALWPESFVEEGNLSQNIFVLRKILGDDQNGNSFIKTIPRRGYKFVAPVKLLDISTYPPQSSLPVNYWSQHTPFRGLQVFEPDDAWLFFGRDSETEELLCRLGRSPVLVVIGNSGCGKSSLIRAGLIPALRNGRFRRGDEMVDSWRVAIIRPSGAPFDYLAETLPNQLAPEASLSAQAEFIADCRSKLPLGGETLRNVITALANVAAANNSSTHILLVVDQFEELFTLTTNRQVRERYIDVLLAASRWDGCMPVHLVLVLRADFYSHCLEHPVLSRCLESNLYNVPRMNHDQLREAIEKRLALAGGHVESGLIDSLLDDVGTEPGDLALLEHALSQLWEKCGGFGCTLTSEAYNAIGRLRGALSVHADAVYGEINDAAQKQLVQKIFLELVHLGEGAPDTKRRVRKEELLVLGVAEDVETLLARLTSSRLISMGGEGEEAFVEVSHEALIREWSTLREWITQNREELRLERRLVQAAREWNSLEKDPGALLQGVRLAQGEEWLLRHPDSPVLLREFLQASIAALLEAEQRELRRQKTAATRLRWFSCVLAGLLLVALGAIWFAHRQQVLAQARALAAQSEQLLAHDQGRALDLAMRGWNTAKTKETYLAVTEALPQTLSILKHDGEVVVSVFSPDGERILTASYDRTARIWDADGRLLATLQGHNDKVEFAAFSPDGQRIVTASYDHTARVWNTADGRLLAILQGHTDAVIRAEFSSNGQRIVTASADHTARVWNTMDGRLLTVLQGHTATVWAATFSPDGQRIATASLDHTARVWNTADGRLLATLQGHTGIVYRPEFSPDGQRIVTASYDQTARVWNTADGRLLATLSHEGGVRRASFSSDGQRIVTASWDYTARVWNTADGRLLATLRHEGKVNHAEFSPDGRYIITASYDYTARLWNATDGRLLATLQGHSAPVMHAAFSPDGLRIITGSADHTARIVNMAGSRVLATLQGHTARIMHASFSPDGQRIVTACTDNTARVWRAGDGRVVAALQGHTGGVWAAKFSPDGQHIVTASLDHTARVWNARDGRLLTILQGHTEPLLAAMFSSDGRRIVTASGDHTARLWNTADGHLLTTLQGHTGAVYSAVFSPDEQRIVTASADHTGRVWNVADGHLLTTLKGHTDAVYAASFSFDGQRIVTASADHTGRVWNTADGRLLAILQGHTDAIWSAAFSPDGQRIATASADHTGRVWNTADGRLLAILQGHTDAIWSAAFSPDGQRIATASADHTARVWNTADGRLLAILQGHTDAIWSVAFSPDGQRIVTASDDQTARVWQVLTLDDIEKILKQ
jgi:WD40 repeat protein/DNA-binding winged helix-turn-helix (wHTH) protein